MARSAPCILALVLVASSLRAQEDPPETGLVRGPYLQSLMGTSAEIVWVTIDVPGDGAVRLVGGGGETFRVAEDASLVCVPHREDGRCHRVRLTGLSPLTTYRYDVLAGETALTEGRELSFRTPPAAGTGVAHFAVIGDSGAGTSEQLAVARILESLAPEGLLHTGDVAYELSGERVDRAIFGPYASLLTSTCLFPARGNHDTTYAFPDYFFVPGETRERETTHFSFDWGSAHVVVLDSTVDFSGSESPGAAQVAWLCDDLLAARDSGQVWIVVVLHEPLFSAGPQGWIQGTRWEAFDKRVLLGPIFDRYGVDLVLMGDDHNYQRSHPVRMAGEAPCGDPIPCEEAQAELCYEVVKAEPGPHYSAPGGRLYVVTGGGGRLLYPKNPTAPDDFNNVFRTAFHALDLRISPAMLAVRAIEPTEDGERVIDEFSISRLRLLRGDMNFDGAVNLADAVAILLHLFAGQSAVCPVSGNVDADDSLSLADAVFLLNFLFGGAAAPAAPFPECGPVSDESLGFCERTGC